MSTAIASAGVMLPTSASTPVPAVLQPPSGVSGGGPGAMQAILEQLHGALGAVLGALQGMQAVSGGGAAAAGCGCSQAKAATGALGAPSAAAGPGAPAAPQAPRTQQAGSDWKAAGGTRLQSPLPGAKLTSHYGEVSSIRNHRPHSGTDFAKPQGTPILSAAPGRVAKVGFEEGGLGHFIEVDHGNGWATRYGHMVEKPPLEEGAVVAAGAPIGRVGSSGNSTGPHLHFMVLHDGKHVNPEPYLNGERTIG